MEDRISGEKAGMPLGDMDPEEFRTHGHQVIDWIANYLQTIEEFPVLSPVRPGDIRRALPTHAPEDPEPMAEILADFDRVIMPGITHWNHPQFFSYFGITGSAPGILGELLSAALNVNGMLWRTSPSATELEEVTLGWLRDMMGLPETFDGVIYDTASISTLVALVAAREATSLEVRERGMAGRSDLPPLRLYCSEQAHSSVEKAAITMGLGTGSVRKIQADAVYRMDATALARAIDADREAGDVPMCVVATVGTTATTSVDPVPEIADLCERHGLWLHVDAAYGGAAAIVPEMRWVMNGVDRADSVVVNPHKWLFTPVDLSALYSRRLPVVEAAFSLVPPYLRTGEDDTARNYMNYGPQLGRRFRALKLWFVLRSFGRSGIEARLREHIRLARLFTGWVEADRDWEIVAPTVFSNVVFRACPAPLAPPAQDELNRSIADRVNADGDMFISTTVLRGRVVLRLPIGNLRTEKRHVEGAWERLQSAAAM